MKPSLPTKAALAAGIALAGLGLAQSAQARTDVVFTIGVQAPVYAAQPYVVAPAPVYAPAQPVYVTPRPVYTAPVRIYAEPAYGEGRHEQWRHEQWRRWHAMHGHRWAERDCD